MLVQQTARRCVSAPELIEMLERSLDELGAAGDAMLAFDADGTLWSTDVGDALFEAAVSHVSIREEARPRLAALAREHRLAEDGTPSAIAARLFAAFLGGRIEEKRIAEMLVWCYAGWRRDDWWEFARVTLAGDRLRPAYYVPTLQILRWALDQGLRCLVVSASPQPAVEAGVAALGITPANVRAARARIEHETVLPELAAPLPWGQHKVVEARARAGNAAWIASFGDSAFDFELLRAARIGVAVRAKPELRQRLAAFPRGRWLELQG